VLFYPENFTVDSLPYTIFGGVADRLEKRVSTRNSIANFLSGIAFRKPISNFFSSKFKNQQNHHHQQQQ
jgi:hypothetical protein